MGDWLKGSTEFYNALQEELPFTLEQAGLAIGWIAYCLEEGGKIRINDFRYELNVCSKGLDKLTSIIEEIKKNIDTLQDKERERYIFTLLRPFAGCKDLFLLYEKYPALFDYRGKGYLSHSKNLFVARDFIESYALELDLLLLERGINLLWYQKEADIYIFKERDMWGYSDYFGTEKLAKRYIDEALPKITPQQTPTAIIEKPQQEDLTDRENEYYRKAISKGMAQKTDNGYKWLYCGGSTVSLAYFLNKVFCPKGFEVIPFKKLEKLWEVKRLDSASYQLANAKKPQRWRGYMDTLFEK